MILVSSTVEYYIIFIGCATMPLQHATIFTVATSQKVNQNRATIFLEPQHIILSQISKAFNHR